jgi:hypothetical protein
VQPTHQPHTRTQRHTPRHMCECVCVVAAMLAFTPCSLRVFLLCTPSQVCICIHEYLYTGCSAQPHRVFLLCTPSQVQGAAHSLTTQPETQATNHHPQHAHAHSHAHRMQRTASQPGCTPVCAPCNRKHPQMIGQKLWRVQCCPGPVRQSNNLSAARVRSDSQTT